MFEVIESLAGMVGTMLEYPVMGMLGRMLPAGGSEAGQQVATAVGTSLDNLGTLCSQAGLDRWELLGLAVLSALTVYRKELSSNSVYHGKKGKSSRWFTRARSQSFEHVEGCPGAEEGADGNSGNSRPCACVEGAQRAAAAAVAAATAASVPPSSVDQRTLRKLVESRIRALNLPVNHLQQLRASVDASWASFAAAWEARRGAKGTEEFNAGTGTAVDQNIPCSPSVTKGTRVGFEMPPCSRSLRGSSQNAAEGDLGGSDSECTEWAALKAAHIATSSILRKGDCGVSTQQDPQDAWGVSVLGALPAVSVQKILSFLQPKDLLAIAPASKGVQEAVDDEWVWQEAWIARFGSLWESEKCQDAAARWHLHNWNPSNSSVPQGWKAFFSEFEVTWLEWVAAGHNSETSCMVGLYGRLYDITDFIHQHPGSPETLMDNAGADATQFFEDVGHSVHARELMKTLESLAPTLAHPKSSKVPGNGPGSMRDRSRCVLRSAAEPLEVGRAAAKAAAKGMEAASLKSAETVGGEGGDTQGPFTCSVCKQAFDPMENFDDGHAGALRRKTCKHTSGTLRIFRVPIRAEWAGFYSCCRKHVALSVAS